MQKDATENAVVTTVKVVECCISACDNDPPVAESTISGMIGNTHIEVVSEIIWWRDDVL